MAGVGDAAGGNGGLTCLPILVPVANAQDEDILALDAVEYDMNAEWMSANGIIELRTLASHAWIVAEQLQHADDLVRMGIGSLQTETFHTVEIDVPKVELRRRSQPVSQLTTPCDAT